MTDHGQAIGMAQERWRKAIIAHLHARLESKQISWRQSQKTQRLPADVLALQRGQEKAYLEIIKILESGEI